MKRFPRAAVGNRPVKVSGRTWNLVCDWLDAFAGMSTSGGIRFRAARTGCAMTLELPPACIIAKTTSAGIDAAASESAPAFGPVVLWQFADDSTLAARLNEELACNLATGSEGAIAGNRRVVCVREQPSGKLLVLWELCGP